MGDFRGLLGVRVAVLAAAGFAAFAGLIFAQAPDAGTKTMLALPPAPLLPETLGKLKRVADGDVGDGLGNLDTADSAVLTEDGLKRFARSDYKAGAHTGTVTV